jgi:hypothetical protein
MRIKEIHMNKSKLCREANRLVKAGMSRSAAFKQVWAEAKKDLCWDMDFEGAALGTVKASPVKKLPLNLNYSYDRAVYMALYRKEAGIPA